MLTVAGWGCSAAGEWGRDKRTALHLLAGPPRHSIRYMQHTRSRWELPQAEFECPRMQESRHGARS